MTSEVINEGDESEEKRVNETTKAPPHVLRLERDAECEGCGSTDPAEWCKPWCRKFTLECPGVTDDCRMWFECDICRGADLTDDQVIDMEETEQAHGVEHRMIDGVWMTPTDKCFPSVADGLADAVDWLGADPGVYRVRHHSWDETMFELEILGVVEPAEATP